MLKYRISRDLPPSFPQFAPNAWVFGECYRGENQEVGIPNGSCYTIGIAMENVPKVLQRGESSVKIAEMINSRLGGCQGNTRNNGGVMLCGMCYTIATQTALHAMAEMPKENMDSELAPHTC